MDAREAELIYEAGKETVVKVLLEMDARIRALEEQVLALQKKIASLSSNSTNSSKPPSSDGPQVTKPKKKKKSSRSSGGQKGHKGTKRELLPVEQMDDVFDHYPSTCAKCSAPLDPLTCEESSAPERYQTFELPEIRPIMNEYRCHELGCTCGHRTRAVLPPEVARTQFGPRVHGAIAYLTSVHRIGRRGIMEILNTFFGLRLCLGSVCNCIDRISPELEPVSEEVRQSLGESGNLNIDETGWKCKGNRRYLWVFVSPLAVYFSIAISRGAKVLRSVLGEAFGGVISSDDQSAYSSYHKNGVRQLCWAHLIRKLKGLKDSRSSPEAYVFSKNMLKKVGHIFSCWHAFREGFIDRQELLNATALMRARMKRYCTAYLNSPDPELRTRAKRTLDNWPHLFTFLTHEGVEPTNNRAERAVRPAVQWRKLCFGNQSEDGERFTERILTVTRTCQLQEKNPFHFLSELMAAAFNRSPRPGLLG
ncbi:MAG: IS66 family transposase [Syntrophobacteraceae bacterium]